MDLNPYEELGVARDADEKLIRKAYRDRSKVCHPDAGGSEEEFDRVSTALAVLTDPKKRKTYDDTGRIESDRPDNDRSAALQIIEMQVARLINEYITRGFPLNADPRRMNVPKVLARRIREELPQAFDGIKQGENVVAFYRDMSLRFSQKPGAEDEDFIGRLLTDQIKTAEEQMAGLRLSIRVREVALTILETYEFKMDEASPFDPYLWSAAGVATS